MHSILNWKKTNGEWSATEEKIDALCNPKWSVFAIKSSQSFNWIELLRLQMIPFRCLKCCFSRAIPLSGRKNEICWTSWSRGKNHLPTVTQSPLKLHFTHPTKCCACFLQLQLVSIVFTFHFCTKPSKSGINWCHVVQITQAHNVSLMFFSPSHFGFLI